jgi:hypothetical protein
MYATGENVQMENNKPAVTWNLQSNGRKEFE